MRFFIVWILGMILAWWLGWSVIAPVLTGCKPFTTPEQAVSERRNYCNLH